MTLRSLLQRFHDDDRGAITVDWVVLSAAVIALAAAAVFVAMPGTNRLASNVGQTTADFQVGFDKLAPEQPPDEVAPH